MKKIFSVAIIIFTMFMFVSSSNAAVDETSYYNYLKNLYEQKNPKLNDYLINECHKFLEVFGDARGMAAEVRYVVGLLYLEKKNYPMAVASFIKGLFLDPVSERMNDEREQIKRIITNEKHFKKIFKRVERVIEGPFIEKKISEMYFDFLRALKDIDDEDLYSYMVDEVNTFVTKFPRSAHVEEVQTMSAEIFTKQPKYLEAIASYEKIEALFPTSGNIPSNRLVVAKIRYLELKDYEKAIEEFKYISNKYSGMDVAGDAYFFAGEIYENKIKNLPEAINSYETVSFKYGTNQYAVESLFRVADIYLNDLKNNEKAIETLGRVGRDFSGDARAPESYDEIADIYAKRIKDYDSAITTYKKLAETYPENPIAPERLYEAGMLAEKKLKDYGNAISLYEDLRSMFPESKQAKRAVKRISNLKKKISKIPNS